MCLVVLMLFFSDSSDEQALGFSACYNRVLQSGVSENRENIASPSPPSLL